MPKRPQPTWPPARFERFEKAYPTSMGTARIVTDAGLVYAKAMGGAEGPHRLACELVGTGLAAWFGLPTFDYAVLKLDPDEISDVPGGWRVARGPAFVTRREIGATWGGKADELRRLANPKDVSRLIVFDTLIRNHDRCPPDPTTRRPNLRNVFLSTERCRRGKVRLMAMDHSHCFYTEGDLTRRIAEVRYVQDEGVYCLFDGFRPLIDWNEIEAAAAKLRSLDREVCSSLVRSIPKEWDVPPEGREALAVFLRDRAAFLGRNVVSLVKDRLERGGGGSVSREEAISS